MVWTFYCLFSRFLFIPRAHVFSFTFSVQIWPLIKCQSRKTSFDWIKIAAQNVFLFYFCSSQLTFCWENRCTYVRTTYDMRNDNRSVSGSLCVRMSMAGIPQIFLNWYKYFLSAITIIALFVSQLFCQLSFQLDVWQKRNDSRAGS